MANPAQTFSPYLKIWIPKQNSSITYRGMGMAFMVRIGAPMKPNWQLPSEHYKSLGKMVQGG